MDTASSHMFGLNEVAIAYALAAEHMLGDEPAFVETNPAVVPIFVSMLFQSLEISIKHVGVESGLFTMQDARSRQSRSGHGIKELAALAVEKLGGEPFDPIVLAMTFSYSGDLSCRFIREMICGSKMEMTRNAYASRCLGYGEVRKGGFALIKPISGWVSAIKKTAINLPATIDILSQWRVSESESKHFSIWLRERPS